MGMGPLRAVCLSVLLLFGCDEAAEHGYPRSQDNATAGEVQDTLPLSQLTILSGDNEHAFTVELADNANSRRIGLMNRHDMADADFSRWVAPAALAKVVRFLASADADPIHGAAVPVEGLS